MTTVDIGPELAEEVDEFAGKLFAACLATMELANVELGIRLGLYEALLDCPATPAELSARTGIHERYSREWLEQQAAAGVLLVEGDRFVLTRARAHVLLDDDSDACMKPCAAVVPWVAKALDVMVDEFRRGTGVEFGAFDLHDVQAAFTRPVFANHLTQHWLPAIPEVQERLDAGDRLRIAEVGCGEGLAAVAIARRYPNVEIDGFDLDDVSILAAREAAADAGVSDRVHFEVRDCAELAVAEPYDLVLAVEMLHDVPDPVGVLETMRRLAGGSGAVLVVDERTEDEFTADASEMERLFYAFSTLHCLAVSLQDGGAGTGTVIRASTVRAYAEEAGFDDVEVLDVDHPQFRLYRLR